MTNMTGTSVSGLHLDGDEQPLIATEWKGVGTHIEDDQLPIFLFDKNAHSEGEESQEVVLRENYVTLTIRNSPKSRIRSDDDCEHDITTSVDDLRPGMRPYVKGGYVRIARKTHQLPGRGKWEAGEGGTKDRIEVERCL